MTRTVRSVGLTLALVIAGLGGTALSWTAGTPAAASSGATPLPPGWELCVLEGLSAPATSANVADLDEWQAAEGGSTNNTAAFNPFNTGRTTDNNGAPIPGVISANGFPAFANWAGGCTATVATLFQPNMWVITAALRSGTVAPPAAFLAVVDQSAWCAPSPDGLPCYASSLLAVAGSLPVSSALDVYGNVTSDLRSYQQAIKSVTADQGLLASREQALAASQAQVTTARGQFGAASKALRGFAINEYVSSGLYSSAPLVSSGSPQPLTPQTPQDEDGVVVQQYLGVAASNLVDQDNAASSALRGSELQRDQTAKAVTQAAVTLTSDEVAENRSLTLLVKDVATLEHAGVCATVTITAPTPIASEPSGSASTPATLVPTTTTTTVPATTSTTTTTTTTVPSTVPSSTLTTALPTTTSTSTTTTTVPSTTTTTVPATPAPSAPSTMTPPAVDPGVTALQGCIAPLAPTAS